MPDEVKRDYKIKMTAEGGQVLNDTLTRVAKSAHDTKQALDSLAQSAQKPLIVYSDAMQKAMQAEQSRSGVVTRLTEAEQREYQQVQASNTMLLLYGETLRRVAQLQNISAEDRQAAYDTFMKMNQSQQKAELDEMSTTLKALQRKKEGLDQNKHAHEENEDAVKKHSLSLQELGALMTRFVQSPLSTLKSMMSGVLETIGPTAVGFGALGAAVAGAGLLIYKNAERWGEHALQLQRTSALLGVNVEEFQLFNKVLYDMGASSTAASQGLTMLQMQLTRGEMGGGGGGGGMMMGNLVRTLTAYGVKLDDVKGKEKDLITLLEELHKALSGVTDEEQRSMIWLQALGRFNRELVSVLAQTGMSFDEIREHLHEIGAIQSKEAVQAAAEHAKAMRALGEEFEAVGNAIDRVTVKLVDWVVKGLTPSVHGIAFSMQQLVNATPLDWVKGVTAMMFASQGNIAAIKALGEIGKKPAVVQAEPMGPPLPPDMVQRQALAMQQAQAIAKVREKWITPDFQASNAELAKMYDLTIKITEQEIQLKESERKGEAQRFTEISAVILAYKNQLKAEEEAVTARKKAITEAWKEDADLKAQSEYILKDFETRWAAAGKKNAEAYLQGLTVALSPEAIQAVNLAEAMAKLQEKGIAETIRRAGVAAMDEEIMRKIERDQEEMNKINEEFQREGMRTVEVWANQVSTIVTDFSRGIADMIVSARGFGDTVVGIFKEFGRAIIRTMIETTFDPLRRLLMGLGATLGRVLLGGGGGIGGGIGGFGGGGGGGGGVASAAAAAMPNILSGFGAGGAAGGGGGFGGTGGGGVAEAAASIMSGQGIPGVGALASLGGGDMGMGGGGGLGLGATTAGKTPFLGGLGASLGRMIPGAAVLSAIAGMKSKNTWLQGLGYAGAVAPVAAATAIMAGGVAGYGATGASGFFAAMSSPKAILAALSNPWVLAAILIAFSLPSIIKAIRGKNAYEAAAMEATRDFGGLNISKEQFKSWLDQMGISESQAYPIRKELMSSPQFLVNVAWPLAQQQGKTSSFLRSLANISTAWGTYNLQHPFAFGVATGSWASLNAAFENAFAKSQALTQNIPDWRQKLEVQAAGLPSPFTHTAPIISPIMASQISGTVVPRAQTGGKVQSAGLVFVHDEEEIKPARLTRNIDGDGVHFHFHGDVFGFSDFTEKVNEAWMGRFKQGGYRFLKTTRA